MQKTVKKIGQKEEKKQVDTPAWVFAAGAALFFLMLAITINSYLKNAENERILMIQKPVNAVTLPDGIRMNNPGGYTVFESESYGLPSYSFVKYRDVWKDNAFFKADLTILPFKETGVEENKIRPANPVLNAAIAAKKILMQEKRDMEISGEKEKTASSDTNYAAFRPKNSSEFAVNSRKWGRYTLVKYEDAGTGKQIKEWNNIYTVYDGKVIVIDYVIVKGYIKGMSPLLGADEKVLKEIDAEILSILQGILFK